MLLESNPERRVTGEKALQHPYFEGLKELEIRDEDIYNTTFMHVELI